ncbi:MAG: hypothetical protein KDE27_31165 [Planctomycetes bacterium]|nr:hypothetical protein [Planctomycetota bacterium]
MTEEQLSTDATATWDAQFAALKTRFPKAKDSIVFCVHALQSTPEIDLADLKARAMMHGIRVTAASVTAARRLLAPPPVEAPTGAALEPGRDPDESEDSAPTGAAAPTRRGRRPRTSDPELDVESMIRGTIARFREEGAAEAERLRDAIRSAIAVLQSALEER